MLKKLYKHEFFSLLRNLFPVYLSLIGLAVISRICFALPIHNSTIFDVFRGFSIFLYVLGAAAIFILGTILIIVRFYRNLLSHEGYLTFSLPFTATQHLNCKLLCGICVQLLSFIALLLSLTVFTIGTDFWSAFSAAVRSGLTEIGKYISGWQFGIIITEVIVLILLSIAEALLMFYVSMAIGQQFKSRVGGAVLSYICIYAALQFIGLLLIIPLSLAGSAISETSGLAFFSNGFTVVSLLFGLLILWILALALVFYFVTRHFLSKKLNLE